MSYLPIARKYRPQRFCEVVGQIHVTQTLQNALQQTRIHPAYLFTGARGVGKTTVARLLAKALNCEKKKPEPCNECSSCLAVLEGKSLDVQEIDGASNTGVDDIRQIREQVKYLASQGGYKIYIIDEVHMLSTSAFNALLKTLEEPPPHVVFIFATTEPHKIPATILSRCQRHDFRRLSIPELVNALEKIAVEEKIAYSREVLSLISHEAGGSLRDAESLLDQAIAFAGKEITYDHLKQMLGFLDRQALWNLVQAILEKDKKAALQQLDHLYSQGVDFSRLSQELLTSLRHLLLINSLGEVPAWLELSDEEEKIFKELSATTSAETIDLLFQMAYRSHEEISRSSFPKMVFEVLLIRMMQIPSLVSLDQILKKLEGVPSPAPIPQNPKHPPAAIQSEKSFGDFAPWLQKEKPQLASIVQHAKRSALEGANFLLFFEEGSVYGEMLLEEDRKKLFQEFLLQFFAKPLGLKIIFEGKDSSKEKEGVAETKLKEAQAMREESLREAQNILGATVEEIRAPAAK